MANLIKSMDWVFILSIIFSFLLGWRIAMMKEPVEIIKEEYLSIRNEYVMIHPKGTDDLIEIFLEQPYKWKVCINGLNHCQEVIIK